MRDIKEYEEIAGLVEAKKPDQKKLLQFKKKLLIIMKKKGLVQASDYIKDIAKDHGDEYIDPLIAYVKFAESRIADELQDSILSESHILTEATSDPYDIRDQLAKKLSDLSYITKSLSLSGKFDPDSDRYNASHIKKFNNEVIGAMRALQKVDAHIQKMERLK